MNHPSALALCVTLLAGSAAAQPHPGDRAEPRRSGEARDEGFRMIEAYIVSNLQESLGLTDEQFVKSLPLVKRLMSDRRQLAERRRRAVRELRQDLESGGATEARVAERLKEVKALEIEETERTRRNLEALDGALTPVQQAKFRVRELEIERRIRDVIAGIRHRRRASPQR